MPAQMPLQEAVMNILALGALRKNYVKVKYNHVFHAFNKIHLEKPELFRGLFFSLLGGEPYSNTLEDILSSLGTWQVIMVENPRYEYLKVNENIFKDIEIKIKTEYGESVLEELDQLAQLFSEEIQKMESAVG